MTEIPFHLQRYVVEQNEARYSPIDHAVWRFILRQLKNYLKVHAHPSYLEGLEKTGIETERIPYISEISKKISKFGWSAVPVSGFLPPAVFMELQSLRILPIASDMRTIDHLGYTPAPDIVHEAAGHAPLLADPEYTKYLTKYAQIAKKAIMSSEDLAIYEAIRNLSDIKEKPGATAAEIETAQKKLEQVTADTSYVSEAAELARMNWWTAEYGLIGDVSNPRIFGAGLLSSVAEAKECLSSKVRKIPLTVKCIEQSYDITEPQPQLFVTPSFEHLGQVLDEMSSKMAFTIGGVEGMKKAVQAKTVNTAELSSGLQVAGVFTRSLSSDNKVIFMKVTGPAQLCVNEKELMGHSKKYHAEGFSTPVGEWKSSPGKCPSELTDAELGKLGITLNSPCTIEFNSGIKVQGVVRSLKRKHGKLVILTWDQARVEGLGEVFYQPEWGPFDMAVGREVVSVFGGPADRRAYGEVEEFVAARVPDRSYTPEEKKLHRLYLELRMIRDNQVSGEALENALRPLLDQHREFKTDWLFLLEAFELLEPLKSELAGKVRAQLEEIAKREPSVKSSIQDGLALVP